MRFNLLLNFLPKYKYRNTSYSQCGEDLVVRHIFQSLKIPKPSYIDIGAYHPFSINNTALFYLNGSRGINIEPNSRNFSLFEMYRKRDINLNIGIASKLQILDYYEMNVPALNTFSLIEVKNNEKEGYKIVNVSQIPVKTIKYVLDKYWGGNFPDFLSIDTEGLESKILNHIDFKKNYPKVICIEMISFSVKGKGVKDKRTIKFLKKNGYLLYADTNINSVFVRQEEWIRNERKL